MLVLCKTRHHYDSYRDFWRLVDAAKIPTCYVDQIDTADDTKTYVFTPINGEINHRLDDFAARRCKLVWWNLERPEDKTLASSLDKLDGKLDAIWVSDRTYAALDARFTYVPVAGHPQFGTRSSHKLYDVCHLSYLWGRRAEAVTGLIDRGITIAPPAWGRAQQDDAVAKSCLMLNMHQYEGMNTVAPIRFAIAGSYAIPIVSEDFSDLIARDHHVLLVASLPDLVAKYTQLMLSDLSALAFAGEELYQRMCVKTDFGREVEKAARRI